MFIFLGYFMKKLVLASAVVALALTQTVYAEQTSMASDVAAAEKAAVADEKSFNEKVKDKLHIGETQAEKDARKADKAAKKEAKKAAKEAKKAAKKAEKDAKKAAKAAKKAAQ